MFNKNTEHGANVIFVISRRCVGLGGGDQQTQSWHSAKEGGASWREEDERCLLLIANIWVCVWQRWVCDGFKKVWVSHVGDVWGVGVTGGSAGWGVWKQHAHRFLRQLNPWWQLSRRRGNQCHLFFFFFWRNSHLCSPFNFEVAGWVWLCESSAQRGLRQLKEEALTCRVSHLDLIQGLIISQRGPELRMHCDVCYMWVSLRWSSVSLAALAPKFKINVFFKLAER